MPKQTLTERLATILAEVASLPDHEAGLVTSDALASAYQEVGCGMREDLVLIVARMAEQATDLGHADQADQEGFYYEEATFEASDHKPSDCRKWSRAHGKARDAYGKANLAFVKARALLAKRLAKADL